MPKKNSTKKIKISHASHAVRMGALAGMMLVNTVAGNPVHATNAKNATKKTAKTAANIPNKDILSTPVKLDSQQDIEKLFDYAIPVIFAELILEEVPMSYVYADGGKVKKKSTCGVGSTFSPINISSYNDSTAKWFYIAENPNTFWGRQFSYEEMLQLAIGWGKYRTYSQQGSGKFVKNNTVLNKMFTKLKGISLTPYEFAALYCAVYNNENNINKLLPLIKRDYKDKIKCANHIRKWWNEVSHNSGTKTRCLFESLVFLNLDDFCDAMMNMQTKPSARASCIQAAGAIKYCGTQITSKNCKTISNACKSAYLHTLYRGTVVSPARAMKGLDKYFTVKKTSSIDILSATLQADYNKAIKLYEQGKYRQALNAFLDLQKRGAEGPDLLNDIAITCFNLQEYDKCIEACQDILQTGVKSEYAKACYNAGKAYEAKGNYDKALKNYQKALEYYNKYGVDDTAPNINYLQLYQNAINRVKMLSQSSMNKKTEQSKSSAFLLAASSVKKKTLNSKPKGKTYNNNYRR